MIKTMLIVTVMMGLGNQATYSRDTTVMESMDECKSARLVQAQSLFPRDWMTTQTETKWEAKEPGFFVGDRFKLECLPIDNSAW